MSKSYIITILFTLCMSYSYAQYNIVIKNDDDAFHCLELIENEEQSNEFNEDFYYKTVFELCHYFIERNEIPSLTKLLDNTIYFTNYKLKNRNTPYIRELYLYLGRNKLLLNSYDDAIHYLLTLQTLCDSANENEAMYILLYTEMANAYVGKKDFLLAKLYIEEAIGILEEAYGTNILNLKEKEWFQFQSAYAKICASIGYTNKAEVHYKNHIEKSESSSKVFQIACNNLACVLLQQEKWEESEKYFKMIKPFNDDMNKNLQSNLSLNYLGQNKTKEAVSHLINYNKFCIQSISSIFAKLTLMDIEDYWAYNSLCMLGINACIAYESHDSMALSNAYDITTFCKTLRMGIDQIIKKEALKSENKSLRRIYNEYNELRERLSHKHLIDSEKNEIVLNMLHKEYELKQSFINLETIKNAHCNWYDIQNKLKEDEVAIEFCYVPLKDFLVGTSLDSVLFYGAFILQKNESYPKLILLDKIEKIDELTSHALSDEYTINEFYSKSNSNAFYDAVWKKIIPYLTGINTIYYSTIGELSNVNSDILRDSVGQYMYDKYNMIRVYSTSKIVDIKNSSKPIYKTANLFGGAKYDTSKEEMINESNKYISYSGISIENLIKRDTNNRGTWAPIAGTESEVRGIKERLSNKDINIVTMTGVKANEESFKNMSGNSPDIIHVASHGFAIKDYIQANNNPFVSNLTAYSRKEEYLLWTGLLFSGANSAWTGNSTPYHVEDGILTADEISRLDLSNTKLVVLSACETARGIVDPIDGVLGLQHAFKKAGVGTVIMSLWKIPDYATSLLMNHFYTYLLSGLESRESLKNAMNDVRKIYPDPYYWGGFIILH